VRSRKLVAPLLPAVLFLASFEVTYSRHEITGVLYRTADSSRDALVAGLSTLCRNLGSTVDSLSDKFYALIDQALAPSPALVATATGASLTAAQRALNAERDRRWVTWKKAHPEWVVAREAWFQKLEIERKMRRRTEFRNTLLGLLVLGGLGLFGLTRIGRAIFRTIFRDVLPVAFRVAFVVVSSVLWFFLMVGAGVASTPTYVGPCRRRDCYRHGSHLHGY